MIIYIVFCQEENGNILMWDNDDQNTMHVFAPKGIHDTYLKLNVNNINFPIAFK